MAQTIFPNSYQQGVDRGGMSDPGQYDPSQTQPQPQRRYLRMPNGDGSWTWSVIPDGTTIDENRVAAQGGQIRTLPVDQSVPDGYREPADTSAAAPATPPPAEAAPPPQVAPRPEYGQQPPVQGGRPEYSVPQQGTAPQPLQTAPAPAAAPQPATAPTPPPSTAAAPGPPGPINNTLAAPDLNQQWVRIIRGNVASDLVGDGKVDDGKSTIVPLSSALAQSMLQDPAQKDKVRAIDTSYTVHGQQIINPEVMLSSNFQALTRMHGGNIIDYTEGPPPPIEGVEPTAPGYTVKFQDQSGLIYTYKLAKMANGDGGTSWRVTSAPAVDTSKYNGPDKQEVDAAAAAHNRAQAALAQAQEAYTRGQATKQDLDNASLAADNAEKAYNTAAGFGNVTHTDAIKNAEGQARVVNLQVQSANTAQQTASTAQGTVNQTYQNILQFYRDQGNDEATAQRLTMEYFNNKANVDAGNNNLALNAAKAGVDAETAANTQRVSLANNRLTQAQQGFTDDFRQANDLNQYLKPGSSKGGDAFFALQAVRMANAKKYGAFDVNDSDLKFDPSKLPVGIRAFANPSNPSFATYPSLDDLRNESYNTADRWGVHNREQPPGLDTIPKPKEVPSANNVPGPPGAARPGTAAAAAQQRAATPGNRPTAQQVSDAQANDAAMLENASGRNPNPNEKDDDVITVNGPSGRYQVSRAGYRQGVINGSIKPSDVMNAEPGSDYTLIDGQYVRNPFSSQAPASSDQSSYGGTNRVLPQQAADNTSPTDIITYRNPENGWTGQISRAELEEQRGYYPDRVNNLQILNAESGDLYQRLDDGTYVKKAAPSSPSATPQTATSGNVSQAPPTYTTVAGGIARTAEPAPSSYVRPVAMADLSGPSAGLQYTQQALANPDADEEYKRRQRQQSLLGQFGTPEAIYGLFDKSYDFIPTFS